MILKNLFLDAFNENNERFVYLSEASPERRSEALKEAFKEKPQVNQVVIDAICNTDGNLALSTEETEVLKQIGIADSEGALDRTSQVGESVGEIATLLSPEEYQNFLKRLQKRRPDLYEIYSSYVEERTEAVETSTSAREAIVAAPRTHKVAKGDTLSKIAKKYGTTVANLLELNPHIPGRTNGKLEGADYIILGEEIVIGALPTTEAEVEKAATATRRTSRPGDPGTVEAVELTEEDARILEEAGAVTPEQAREETPLETEQETSLRETILADPEAFLFNQKIQLPEFLRGGKRQTSHDDWAELIRFAGQETPEVKRLAELIDDQPLGWYPSDLRNALRQAGGRMDTLTFNEITRYEFGETQKRFFENYRYFQQEITKAETLINTLTDPEEIQEQRTRLLSLYDEVEKREGVIVQAHKIFIALDQIQEGEIIEENAFSVFATRENLQVRETPVPDPTEIYDINGLLHNEEVVVDNAEGLATTHAVVDEIRTLLENLGAKKIQANKADAGFVLRLIVECYGLDHLIESGAIMKGTDRVLYLTRVPMDYFTADNPRLKTVAESLRIRRNRLEFDTEAVSTFRLDVFKQLRENYPEQYAEIYARELGRAIFRTRGETLSMEEVTAGETLFYRQTDQHLLATVRDAESALEDLLTHRREFVEEGQEDLLEKELLGDFEYFLETGIDNFFQDENLDILSVLETAGVPIQETHRRKIRELDRKLHRKSERAGRLGTRKEELEARINHRLLFKGKGPTADQQRRLDQINSELDPLTEELKALRKERMDLLQEHYIEPLQKALALPKQGESISVSELSELQIIFIHNGYAISRGRRTDERIEAETEMSAEKQEIIERYSDNEIVSHWFQQFEESGLMPYLEPVDLIQTAEEIQRQIELLGETVPLTYEEALDQVEGDSRASQYLFSLAGMLEMQGNDITAMRFAIAKPIQVAEGITIDLVFGAGGAEGDPEFGAGAGFSAYKEAGNFMFAGNAHIGAGFRGPKKYMGTSVGGTIGFSRKGFSIGLTGRAGIGISEGTETIGVGGTLSIGWVDMERFRERKVEEAQHRTGTEVIEATDLTREEKIEIIASIPGFDDIAAELEAKTTPEIRAKILWEMFTDYARQVENVAIADLQPPPITGFTVSVVPFPPFVLPMIKFAVAGRPKVYFGVPDDPNTIFTESGIRIQEEINRQYANAETVEDPNMFDYIDKLNQLRTDENNEPILTGRAAIPIDVSDLYAGLDDNLDRYNQSLNPNGINLAPGEGAQAGLLQLNLHGIRGNVDVRIDPAIQARLIIGDADPPTKEDLYIAFNQLRADETLEILREEFISTSEEGGSYKYTRITIRTKQTAPRTFQQFEDSQAGKISFRGESGLVHFEEAGGNILTWEEYLEQKEALIDAGLSTLALMEFQEQLAEFDENFFANAPEIPVRNEELAEFAEEFFKNNKSLCLEATLFDEDMGADYEILEAKVREELTISPPATDLEIEYIFSVIRKQTYVSNSGLTEEQRERRYQRNIELFRRVLTDKFGEDIANQILADIEAGGSEEGSAHPVPLSADLFTVVSRSTENGKAEGLRADTMQSTEILRATDYSDDPEMKEAFISTLRPLPEEPVELFRTSLGINLIGMPPNKSGIYYMLKSPEKHMKMLELREDPDLINVGNYRELYEEFRGLVEQLRASEQTGATIRVTTDYGADLNVVVNPEIYAGRMGYCDNPTIMVDETIGIRLPGGEVTSAMEVTLQELPTEVRKEIYEFSLGGTGKREKEEVEVEDAVGENEDVEAGTGPGGGGGGNLDTDGKASAPDSSDGGGAPQS